MTDKIHTINYKGFELEAHGFTTGVNTPASNLNPPEFEEFTLNEVYLDGRNINDLIENSFDDIETQVKHQFYGDT